MLIQEENYINPQEFQNFLACMSQLSEYNYKMKPKALQMFARIQYGCGLRVSEVLSLRPTDFDLDNLVLTLNHTKTGFRRCKCSKWEKKKLVSSNPECKKCRGVGKTRKPQYTTILPGDVPDLRVFLSDKIKSRPVFDFNRVSVWEYYKQVGKLAGLDVKEQQDVRKIEGVWTHLLRKSRAKLMKKHGADETLIKLKLRHAFTTTERYTKPDLSYLKVWEQKEFGNEVC